MGQLTDILNQKRKAEKEAQDEYDFDNLRTILKRKKELDYAARQDNYMKQREKQQELDEIQLRTPQRNPEQTDLPGAGQGEADKPEMEKKLAEIQNNLPSYLTGISKSDASVSSYPAAWQDKNNELRIKNATNTAMQERREKEEKQREAERLERKTGFHEGNQFIKYDDLSALPDYDSMVQEGQRKDNVLSDKVHVYGPFARFDKDKREVLQTVGSNISMMTDTEKDLYFYLNGKYGSHTALNYIKSINGELNERLSGNVHKNAAALSKDHPIVGTALDAGVALEGGVAYPAMLARQIYRDAVGDYRDLDANDPMFMTDIISGGVREGLSDNETIKDIIPNKGVRDFLTGTGLSMTENLARLPMGYTSLAVAAGDAGLSGTRNAVQRGADSKQAIELGMANAAAEAFFEKFSLEGLKSLKASPGRTLKEFLKNMGKQALTEGSEETFTEMANTLSDQAIMGDLSQYNLNLEQYRKNGLSEDEAKKKAFEDVIKNIALSGAGGALSGGILGGGSQALGMINENNALNQYGKNIDQDYRELAQGIDTNRESYKTDADHQRAVDLQSLAQEYAERQANKEFIPNVDKARYERDLLNFNGDLQAEEMKSYMDQGMTEDEAWKRVYNNASGSDNEAEGTQAAQHTEQEPQEPTSQASEGHYNQPGVLQAEQTAPMEQKANNVENSGLETNQEAPMGTGDISTKVNPAEAYRKPYGKNGQSALLNSYDGMIDIPTYNRAFGRAYDAGYHGIDTDIANHSAIMSVLTGEQFTAAYRAGAQDFNAENNIDLKTGKPRNMIQGTQKEGGLGNVAETATMAQRKVAEHVGKMTGLKINLVDGMEQPGAVGSYKDGEITLSVNSSDFNSSLTHELTHHIKAYSPKGYKMYSDIVIEKLMQSKGESLENIMESYENRYSQAGQELTREQIREEVVADATQKFFNDSEFISNVIKKDRTVAQRITDFLTDAIEAIKELMKKGSTRTAAKGLEEDMRYYEDARDAWMAALVDASDTYKTGTEIQKDGQKERNILERPDQVTEQHIEDNYHAVRGMEPVASLKGNEFSKGEKNLGQQVREYYDSLGNVVHNDVVGDIIINNRSFKDDSAHGMGRLKAIAFQAVPEVLENGKVLRYSKNWKERGYDSAIIGAKINIGEGEYKGDYYELCVVKLDEKNRLYLHEVHTTKMDETSFKTGAAESGLPGEVIHPSIYSIFDKLTNVNEDSRGKPSEMTEGNSLRYQLEDVDESVTDKKIDALLHENQSLREANELLGKQFKLTPASAVRQQDVGKVADGLLKEYNSTYKSDTLTKNLDKLYGYIRSAEHVDSAALTEAATSIAKSVLKQSQQLDTGLTQQYKDLRDQIRNTKITISDQDKADLESVGGYNTFRRRNFGRMKLGNDGIPVDSLYQELSEQHPELFPEDITHPADQLSAIEEALNQTDSQVENPYHANIDEMSYMVGQDILQSYFDVRAEKPTYADRRQAEVQKVKRDYAQKMKEYKENLKQTYKNNLKQVRKDNIQKIQELANAYGNLADANRREQHEYYKRKMDDLRNEKNQALAAMQQRNREQFQKIRDRQKAKEAKKVILKESKAMQSWLLKPTDTRHIPQSLRGAVAEFLSNIDFSSKNDGEIETQRTKAWNEAKQAFENIVKNEGVFQRDDGGVSYMEIDPDLIERIKGITEKTNGIEKLDNLDAYSMEELKKTVVSMKKALTEANSLLSNRRSGELSMLAEGVFKDLQDRKTRAEYAAVIGHADKMLNYDMLDPQTMFGQMGKNMKSTYDAFRDGLDSKTSKLRMAQKHVQKLLEENNISYKDLREWGGEDARPTKFQTSGGQVDLTVAQVMSLYELNKRPQAKTHMYDRAGGIKPAPRMGKLHVESGKVIMPQIEKAYHNVRITEADVHQITSTLTPEQKALADGMQRFMWEGCSKWGNEVSMMMYGYEKFTARNYFPIVTDDNYIQTRQGGFKDKKTNIKNMGFTKSTVMKANKPIIIENIFDVYSRQADQMSTYNAYVTPLSDLNKIFNYIDMRGEMRGSSIKQEIERTYGKSGNEYIDKLIQDINGSLNTDKSIGDKLLSNMKAASVAGNLRVAIQQPTAYVRAAMEISPKYLIKGAATMTKKGQWERICQYAPIAQWKDWGFYRMDTSRQMKDVMFNTDSRKQRFVNKTMILAEEGDKLAWNRLWRACEFECRDTHPELQEGTEAFYKEVGRRFSEIVDKTQVVDSVLHRTQIMRSQNGLDKMASAFMAEPLKTYNMLYRAKTDLMIGAPKAKSRAVRAGAVFLANAAATSIAAAVMDAMRNDDRDKDWMEKYLEAVGNNLKDNINLINNIPYARDAYAVLAGGYTPNRPDVAAYQDIYYSVKKIQKLYEGQSDLTPQAVTLDAAKSVSKLLGLPINSIARDSHALLDTAINGLGSDSANSADYTWLKQKYNIGSSKNLGMYAGMMVEAHRNGNKNLEKQIKVDLNKAGIDNDTISSKIQSIMRGELISKNQVNPLIDEAAHAKKELDLDTYETDFNKLLEEGYSEKLIASVISSRTNQLKEGTETDWEAEVASNPDDLYGGKMADQDKEGDMSLYEPKDIIGAVEAFENTSESLKTFNRITQSIVDSKIKAGKTKEDAAKSIKSTITKKYKADWIEAYKAGNKEKYEAIQKKLVCLKVNGKTLYTGEDLYEWRKEARKK